MEKFTTVSISLPHSRIGNTASVASSTIKDSSLHASYTFLPHTPTLTYTSPSIIHTLPTSSSSIQTLLQHPLPTSHLSSRLQEPSYSSGISAGAGTFYPSLKHPSTLLIHHVFRAY